MSETIAESVANIITALVRGQSPKISKSDLRLLSRVAGSSPDATFALGGITAALAASEAIRRVPGSDVGPIFPELGEGPVPIEPGPYPPDFPQPIEPGPPDNPEGPQPIETGRPWFEQMVSYVVLDEFLVPAELETISRFALENEDKFEPSQVVVPGEAAGRVDFRSRRSNVVTDLGNLGEMFRERVRQVLPLVAQRLRINAHDLRQIDVQMTASNDQEFFVAHRDDGEAFPNRAITYVYFFHREPASFTGGELKLFHPSAVIESEGAPSRFTMITPAQNQIVFFPSSLLHEVTALSVPSKAFADSRFTVNGWIHL
jgi:SM-20-related protein